MGSNNVPPYLARYETAARDLCSRRQLDPDLLVNDGTKLWHAMWPLWCNVAVEIQTFCDLLSTCVDHRLINLSILMTSKPTDG